MKKIWSVDPSARHNKSRHHHQSVLLEVFSCKDKNKHHKLPFQTKTTLTTGAQCLASICFQKQLFQSETR